MSKPPTRSPYSKQDAPRTEKQRTPLARTSKSSAQVQPAKSRDRAAGPYSKGKPGATEQKLRPDARPDVRPGSKPVRKPVPGPDSGRPKPVPSSGAPSVIGAVVIRRAADRLRTGYLWVYASDIESITLPSGSESDPPRLLPVADSRGLLLGTALYSPASQIALRMVSREALSEAGWLELLALRLRRAIARRKTLLAAAPDLQATDSCRLCFSEADELPGLIADKYNDLVILQLLSRGLDTASVRETCVRVFREELEPAAILERPDAHMRVLEELSVPDLAPLWAARPAETVTSTSFQLNGLAFHYDAGAGQKTGAFLDQRLNYAAVRDWARRLAPGGRALDVCTYQGGFALHLAQAVARVTGIDSSRASLTVAEQNLEANRSRITAEVDWVEADAFEILRDWSDARESFDAIVLDPPAFAKTHRAVEGALRGYKELNLRALKMLRPGGLFVTCSCSHHVGWPELEGTVAAAAIDAGKRVRVLERRGAAIDHPVILNLPETEYLKCLILEVE